jgi:hypothetical protein
MRRMDPITAFSLCLLFFPVFGLLGWLIVENHDRFSFQIHRPERRGFEVIMRPRGYSFTEVMFAVVVLGVGFVMLAAMFPVAISQTAATSEESIGASIARGAVKHVENSAETVRDGITKAIVADEFQNMLPTEATALPAPAPFFPFDKAGNGQDTTELRHGLWHAVKGNLILQTDPRYAFVPFYSRENGSNLARLVIVVVRARERAAYDATDVTPDDNANLQGRAVTVAVENNVGGTHVDWVTFSGPNAAGAAEGTCVVISSHGASGPTTPNYYSGLVFRVGRKVLAGETLGGSTATDFTWELVPGNDFIPSPGADDKVDTADDLVFPATTLAYIVGRELESPGTAGVFRGVSQEVSYYSTFIQVRP